MFQSLSLLCLQCSYLQSSLVTCDPPALPLSIAHNYPAYPPPLREVFGNSIREKQQLPAFMQLKQFIHASRKALKDCITSYFSHAYPSLSLELLEVCKIISSVVHSQNLTERVSTRQVFKIGLLKELILWLLQFLVCQFLYNY